MTETPTGGVRATCEDQPTDAAGDGPRAAERATAERDREFARQLGLAGLAWALIWSVIIAGLFLFGDTISALVV